MLDTTTLDPWLQFLTQDPAMRLMQIGLVLSASALVFLIFYTTRDIILRTHSLVYQIVSIILVACVPVIGFLLYLLIRPARTVKERDLERLLRHLAGETPVSKMKQTPKEAQG